MSDANKKDKPVPKVLRKNGLVTWLAFAVIAIVAINSVWKHLG
ncbi:hypothetical protein POK33_38540 [Burkholderia cenocepacia]|nr:hypothetical protein [Burkholderia cenocepacia]MDF0506655.1 hypothetical protein [Burkholderia cenocepacia]